MGASLFTLALKIKLKKIASSVQLNLLTLRLDVNIDGTQVYKSRNTSFWPIIISRCNFQVYSHNSVCPFIPAIYYGNSKPEVAL